MSRPFIFILIYCSLVIFANGQCKQENLVINSGEKALYDVYYNWGFVWLHAAEASFVTKVVNINNKKAYHFISKGKTLPNYDWFFKVRDTYQSIIDSATLTPIWYLRKTNEGKYSVKNQYWFNYHKKKVYLETQNSDKPFSRDTLSFTGCMLDLLSAVYNTRNINYKTLSVDDIVPIQVIVDGEKYSLHVRYLGKEPITLRDGRRFNCIKFSVLLIEGTIFTGGENMEVWVSDDRNRIPVYVEAKILVGSIKAQLYSVKGTRYPLSSDFRTVE